MNRALFRSTTAFIGLLLALGVLEVGLRAWESTLPPAEQALFLSPDPLLGWTHTPGIDFFYTNPNFWERDFATRVRFNARGLRGSEEIPDTMAAGHRRILWLGDSFGEAMAVDENRMASELLEQMLNADSPPHSTVINEAVSNYGLTQMSLGYRERWARRWHPHIVLALVSPQVIQRCLEPSFSYGGSRSLNLRPMLALNNESWTWVLPPDSALYATQFESIRKDLYDGRLSRRARHNDHLVRDTTLPGWKRVLGHSYLYSMFATRKGSFLAALGIGREVASRPLAVDTAVMKSAFAAIEDLRNACRNHGARLVLFETFAHPRWKDWRNYFLAEATARGFEVIRVGDRLTREGQEGRAVTLPIDGHWNEHGNAVVAEEIGRWLKATSATAPVPIR